MTENKNSLLPLTEDSDLAKITSKNQITLPKRLTAAIGPTEYFDVETQSGQIILTPDHIGRADVVRAKLAELGLDECDIASAVLWARENADNPQKKK